MRASPGSRATSSRAASRCWWPSPTCRAAAPASRPWWRACSTVRCRSRSWGALAARRSLADGFGHLVALDPPPGGMADPQLRTVPRAHLAWGPAEAEFALTAARAELDLRPQLTEVYRALRELPPGAPQEHLEASATRQRPLPPQRARLRPSRRHPHGAQPDRARHRRPNLPCPRRRPERPRAIADLPRGPRPAGRNRASAGSRAPAHAGYGSHRLARRSGRRREAPFRRAPASAAPLARGLGRPSVTKWKSRESAQTRRRRLA